MVGATKLDKAARLIMLRWLSMMLNGECRLKDKTVRQWLACASVDSQVMHDNCDANMVFHEVLYGMGLIPKNVERHTAKHDRIWNAVTASEYRRLECCASAIGDLLK